jgi:hypothetical protein
MKPILLTIALLLVLFVAPLRDDDEPFEGVVMETVPKIIVVFDSRSRKEWCAPNSQDSACVHVTYEIPPENWGEFPAWQPLPSRGQVLKARWEGRRFIPVESCAVRVSRATATYLRSCGNYCNPPVNALTPRDCRLPHTEFVEGLLRQVKGQG